MHENKKIFFILTFLASIDEVTFGLVLVPDWLEGPLCPEESAAAALILKLFFLSAIFNYNRMNQTPV